MAYISVPKDLHAVKPRVLFHLTRRQLLCFGAGALTAIPLFFLLRPLLGTTTALYLMVLVLLPFFLLALYEKDGMHLEQYLGHVCRVLFLRPRVRPYRTRNYYACLERQAGLYREVMRIVSQDDTETHPAPAQGDPPGRVPGPESGREEPVRPGHHPL